LAFSRRAWVQLKTIPIKMKTPTERRLLWFSAVKENGGGIKIKRTSKADMSVETIPAALPPRRELKKAVGKKRNQTYGEMYGQKSHCTQQVTNGSNSAMRR
jgi:hypothetical protein